MKYCPSCGGANSDAARFCNDCGFALVDIEPPASRAAASGATTRVDATSLARSLAARGDELQGQRRADIMFVLDCTGSMQGEIDAIRDAIIGFADTIASDGVRARVGLIEFRDRLHGEEHRALTFAGQPFTNDPALFRREVSALRASGGGDIPESSLDAVVLAAKQPFEAGANKVIVLVTDAPPHIPDRETRTVDEALGALQSTGIQQLYLVISTHDPESQVYLKLLEGRKGMAFELGSGSDFSARAEHFKRTLMGLGKTISSATR